MVEMLLMLSPILLANPYAESTLPWSCTVATHLPLPPYVPQQYAANYASRDSDAADDGNPHEAFLGHLVVNHCSQICRLQISGLLLREEVVVSPCLAVVAQLVVAQSEIVQALPASFWRGPKDLREEHYAEMLVGSCARLHETLHRGKTMLASETVLLADKKRERKANVSPRDVGTHPCIVELGLHANHIPLLLVLGPEHIELGWAERSATDKAVSLACRSH